MTQKITWTPDMSVGVEEIDNQHKYFIGIISDFYSALNERKIQTELGVILDKLIDYAVLHFNTEEKYFDKFNYEFKDEHKAIHQKVKQQLLDFKENFNKSGVDIVPDFMDFLTNWLVDHMESEDQKYVKCFHEHGLY